MSDIDERLIKFFLNDFSIFDDVNDCEFIKEAIKEVQDYDVENKFLKEIYKDANEIYSIFNKWRIGRKEFIDKLESMLPSIFNDIYVGHDEDKINKENITNFIEKYAGSEPLITAKNINKYMNHYSIYGEYDSIYDKWEEYEYKEYGNYAVRYSYGCIPNNKVWNECTSFDNKNDAMSFVRNDCGISRWTLFEASVEEDDDTIWEMGDDEKEEKEQELEKIKTENKQLKDEIKQLKLKLEKQTLSNVLDKKVALGTKQDINEILNTVGYTE